MKLLVLSAATDDVDAIARTIAADNLSAALGFYDAVESTYTLLTVFPGVGTKRAAAEQALAGLRSYGVRGFRNYIVYIIPRSDRVEIVRVLHAARDRQRWLGVREP